jgi:hypothetical protein
LTVVLFVFLFWLLYCLSSSFDCCIVCLPVLTVVLFVVLFWLLYCIAVWILVLIWKDALSQV